MPSYLSISKGGDLLEVLGWQD